MARLPETAFLLEEMKIIQKMIWVWPSYIIIVELFTIMIKTWEGTDNKKYILVHEVINCNRIESTWHDINKSYLGRSTKNHVHTKVDVPLYKTTNINQKNKSHEKNFTSASNQHSVFNDTEKATNSPSKPRLEQNGLFDLIKSNFIELGQIERLL